MKKKKSRLLRIRLKKGWSQVELAKRSGISRMTIHKIENGYKRVNLVTLQKISKALGIEQNKIL